MDRIDKDGKGMLVMQDKHMTIDPMLISYAPPQDPRWRLAAVTIDNTAFLTRTTTARTIPTLLRPTSTMTARVMLMT